MKELRPGETYLSPLGPSMIFAMPVYQAGTEGRPPVLQGAVVLDFAYPLQDFQRTTWIILRTFVIITALSLGIALFLTTHCPGSTRTDLPPLIRSWRSPSIWAARTVV